MDIMRAVATASRLLQSIHRYRSGDLIMVIEWDAKKYEYDSAEVYRHLQGEGKDELAEAGKMAQRVEGLAL